MPRYRLWRPPAGLAGIDLALVERLLVKHHANVRAAAAELRVPSHDLRRLTWSVPRLIDAALEEAQRMIDRAEENIQKAVHDDSDPHRALQASIFVLSRHRVARERGWSRAGGGAHNDDSPPQTIRVCWVGDSHGYQPPSAAPEERSRQISDSASLSNLADEDA